MSQTALEESTSVSSLGTKEVSDQSSTKKKKKEKTVSLNEFIGGTLSNDVRNQLEANGTLSSCKQVIYIWATSAGNPKSWLQIWSTVEILT
jgi:hypothetical protein